MIRNKMAQHNNNNQYTQKAKTYMYNKRTHQTAYTQHVYYKANNNTYTCTYAFKQTKTSTTQQRKVKHIQKDKQ